ncbi:TPA: MarR family transcriptional regulator [Bacillus wiedmannii]|nr:MarR family transcriptional regulator [Bacillus wiedmannii]
MLFMLDEVMTPREACDRWGITQDALRMKIKRYKKEGMMNKLIGDGKIKYYKPEGKQRGEWILTVEAMNILFPKNIIEEKQKSHFL